MSFDVLRKEYPSFSKTEKYIFQNFDVAYFREFEDFLRFCLGDASTGDAKIAALLSKLKRFIRYSHEFTVLQIRLNKSLEYKYSSFNEVEERVYNNPMMDDYYLDGLAFSQYLWPNHYKMNRFLVEGLGSLGSVRRAIDVPCGTGVQSWLARRHSTIHSTTLCDLSAYSVNYARKLHSHFDEEGDWEVFHSPVEKCEGEFDLIINGELLEHLEEPEEMLKTLERLLAKDGVIYLTTAIFAAAIDHIYMFRSAQEVRDMLKRHFKIESELVLPVSLQPHSENMYNQPMNYACFLRRK